MEPDGRLCGSPPGAAARIEAVADLSVEILREIRDEIRRTNERLDATNERLDDQTNRLDSRLDGLQQRQCEMEIRLATELVAVAGAVHELKDAVLADRKLRDQVADHEARLRALETIG